ncbi:polyprotein [Gentian mosaic virus]|uniref:Polyprotein n=2 Tax=Gentian mosaic virus TaxID=182452 RepID=Q4W8R5_9SECO|nr:polyprotein [Gentian mosaic virus]BAD99002.1 polyprotein [Gentian mosaic virus]
MISMLILFLFSFSFVTLYLYVAWKFVLRPVITLHFENSIQYIDPYTYKYHFRHSFDSELKQIFKWTLHFSFPYQGESKFSPKYTLSEMEREYASVTPAHVVPKDVLLKRAGDYKLAKEGRRSILPSITELYEIGKFNRVSSLLRKNMPAFIQTSEMQAGVIKGDGNGLIKVPIVNHYEEERADTRLHPETRAKADQIMVAAVEIVNDGFASVNSDITLAGALYDKRHKTLKNSFKGAYASRLGGEPSHIVFYPTHRVPSFDDPNETLELSLVSRDTDFEEQSTLANISVRTVYVRARGPEKVTETRHLLAAKVEDTIKAQQFASENEVVLATPRLYPKVNLDNYALPRTRNVVQSFGRYDHNGIVFRRPKFTEAGVVLNATGPIKLGDIAPGNSSKEPLQHFEEGLGSLSDEDAEDYKEGQALMEEETLEACTNMFPLEGIPETMRLLFSGATTIPLNVTVGTKLTVIYLNDLAKHNGVHNQLLNMVGKIPGSLKCKIFCEVSPATGIGLVISYVEGNESLSLGNNLGRLLGIQHRKWNPAIEPSIDFLVKPFSCCDWWNMHYLGSAKYAPVITILCLDKWFNAPKTEGRISFALYFEPEVILPKQIATLHETPGFMLRKELGNISFPQGSRKAYQFEVNFGKPQVEGTSVTMNFASAYCGLSQFMQADVILDLLLMSSPMMGATFTVALICGSKVKHLGNLQTLDSLPHITFTFSKGGSSSRSLRFKKELFPTLMTLDRWELDGDKTEEVGFYFVIYQRDNVSSSLEGDMVLGVSARSSGAVQLYGVSSGYPTMATRSTRGKTGVRDLGMKIRKPIGYKQGQAHTLQTEFENVFYPVGFWKYEEGKYEGSRGESDISTHYLKMRLDGTKSSEGFKILHSPFVRLLQNCAWFRGTLEWKVVVLANSEMMNYRRTSQAVITAHESSLSSNEFFSEVIMGASGEVRFKRSVVGTVDGFKSMGWDVQGEKKFYKLCIALGNIHEYSAVNVYGRFLPDVEFAGQQKAGHYMLDKSVAIFKEISY